MQKCLLCKNNKFRKFYSIKSFPMYFGALPKKDSSKIRKFPLEISYCKKCNLVQQTKKVKEKFMNEVYSSKYYNCPSPKKSGMGVREILKFWTFFKSIKQAKGKVLEIASFDGYLLSIMNLKQHIKYQSKHLRFQLDLYFLQHLLIHAFLL